MTASPPSPDGSRGRAQALAAPLPPLLAEAERLAANVAFGEHGRRRAGQGDEFWQYRAARPGDPAGRVDWRRSARSDAHFLRETEWQAAQSVAFWVDGAQAMAFSGRRGRPDKGDRARLLALALATLLIRGGERVGLADGLVTPRAGRLQLHRMATALDSAAEARGDGDYGRPDATALPPHSRAVFLSDFLGPPEAVEQAVTTAADRGVKGTLLQILDPDEEAFPYDGRTVFESMGGGLRFETMRAGDLRARYRARLSERRDRLTALTARAGWRFGVHHTDAAALTGLTWLYGALAPTVR